MSLSGTDPVSKFNIVPQNSNTSSVQLTAASDFAGGTYSYTASIFDQFGETSQYEREITIVPAKFRNFNNKWNILYYRIDY